MWLGFAFLSAILLGFYDVFKKKSLKDNPVIPVLFLNTLFSSLLLLPLLLLSVNGVVDEDSLFYAHSYGWEGHRLFLLKAVIVMSSWICGYIGIKNLPITIVGPINATRPVMVLIGALTFLGEKLNVWQWIGVVVAIISFYLLSRSGKKEGIDFKHNKWIFFVIMANILGAVSALFDRWLLSPQSVHFDQVSVQIWNNVYQCGMLAIILIVQYIISHTPQNPQNHSEPSEPFRTSKFPLQWRWSILMISVCLTLADFVYFTSLSQGAAMVSIVSMIRRSSVVVSFLCGALIFKEKNLRSKLLDLLLVILSLLFLFYGSL